MTKIENYKREHNKEIISNIEHNKEIIRLYISATEYSQQYSEKIFWLLKENIELYKLLHKKVKHIPKRNIEIKKIEKKEYKEPEFDEYDNTQNDLRIQEYDNEGELCYRLY
jgi:hypothetical protein